MYALINPIKQCVSCKEVKKAFSEALFANGLYGYYCQECDAKEANND